jgi:hypothetical protein
MLAAEVGSAVDPRRLTPGLWFGAAAEIAVAIAVGAILLHYGSGHAMPDPSGAHSNHQAPQIHWSTATLVVAALTTGALIGWAATRTWIPAVLSAAGLIWVAVSEPVRVLALQSHLVAMAALEVLLVGVPLLLLAAARRPHAGSPPARSARWTASVVIAVALYGLLLIALHLPGVHRPVGTVTMVPLWLTVAIVVIGTGYWTAILLTAGRVRPALRRGALVIGQEIAALLGLAALIVPAPHLAHANLLGLSPSMDQRLGGLLMIITCAAVTLPVLNRLRPPQEPHRLREEHDVH